jgi:uracil-DNA glycosylase
MYSLQQPLFESLRATLKDSVYPAGVMEDRSGRIPGTGFFPGSTGMVEGSKTLEQRRVMVLGQDQDNEKGHDKSEKKGDERYSKTWENMKALFDQAGIDEEDCFFTNYIMGVRVNSKRNTGPSPALAHQAFMRACSAFFMEQLKAQQPTVILTLGMIPFKLLSLVSTSLRFRSIGVESFQALEDRELLVVDEVVFDALPGERFVVVPLCHPSYRLNGEGRFKTSGGRYASEVDLLKDVRGRYLG